MAGPLKWWANRKSRIGLSPSALKPPHVNGKEWWTTPPIAPPQPEHIEYAIRYQLNVACMPPSEHRNQLQQHIAAWLTAARQLLHESVESTRGDLHTTDGLIIAAHKLVQKLAGDVVRLGGRIPGDLDAVAQALGARAARARRERGTELAKRSKMALHVERAK